MKYILVPIDKAAGNIAIICKKYFGTVILKKNGILDAGNETYEKINKNQEEIIQDNLEYNKRLKLSKGGKDKSLPIIYWIPKLHKNPVRSPFIIASNNCSTKRLSKAVFNLFKLIYSQIENFHHKSKFLFNYNKLCCIPERKSKYKIPFNKSTLKTSFKHFMQNCYFMAGNSLLRQKIDIPMGIDPTPFLQISFYKTMKTNTCLNLFAMAK